MVKQLVIAGAAVLALASITASQAVAGQVPTAPTQLKQYDYFLGTWKCHGKAYANPMSPEHATTATVHVEKAVGDWWFHLTYDEDKTAANPVPYHTGVYWGYDSAKKRFVQNCHDSFGGYCTQYGSGWKGDTMMFEGMEQGGDSYLVRDKFMKMTASELVHTGLMQDSHKKWVKTDEEICTKSM